MMYNISHKNNGVYQALLVEAGSQKIAEAYFKEKKPGSEFLGIHEATRDDMRPGKPVMVVPDEFRLEFIRRHQRAFNAKMKALELLGLRSGGWDEKTDKTAIVKTGKREIDNQIVGYMDRDLNIEWKTTVLDVGFVNKELGGVVFVEGHEYLFDYDLESKKPHVYGWGKREQEEKSLPGVLVRNMDGIERAISGAVDEFLSVEELKKEQGMAVDALIAKAEEKKAPVKEQVGQGFERDALV